MKSLHFPHEIRRGSVVVRVYRQVRPATEARPARTIYQIGWHVGGVRKIQQFAELDGALEEARLKAEQLAAGRIAVASELSADDAGALAEARKLLGNVPLLSALEEWKAARDLTGGLIVQAAEAWAARQGTSFKRENVDVVVTLFLDAKQKSGVKTRKTYKPLAHLSEKFAGLPLDTVSSVTLTSWMHERYGHPVYFNTALQRFRTFWRWARKNDFLPRDAQTVADAVDASKVKPERVQFIRTETLRKVFGWVEQHEPRLLAPLVLAALCGLRSSEVHAQQWEDVNLETGHLHVSEAKPNTPAFRLVPICAAAKLWLLRCGERKGRVAGSVVDVELIRDLAKAHGIALPENAFRHSYITHAVAATGDVSRVALNAGNSPSKIFKHYRGLVTEKEGKRWFLLSPTATKPARAVRFRQQRDQGTVVAS